MVHPMGRRPSWFPGLGRALAVLSVVGAAAAAAQAGVSAPTRTSTGPGGSVVSPNGGTVTAGNASSYSIPVEWNASCPLPSGDQLTFHHWNVEIRVTRAADGGSVNYQSHAYVGVTDSGTDNKQGMVVSLAKGLRSETFDVKVTLSCAGAVTVIGSTSVTLSRGNCDPGLMAKAERKYATAKTYAEAGQRELTDADKEATKVIEAYTIDFVKEQALLKTLKRLAAKGGEVVAESAELVGLVYELVQIDKALTGELIPAAIETHELEKTAFEDFQKSAEVAAEAKKDLDAALKQGPCLGPLEDKLNKLTRQADDDEKIHQMVDSWRAAGSNDRYVVDHQLVDERAAIAHARAVLQGSRTTQATSRTVTPKQLKTALADLTRAISKHARVAQSLKRERARDETLHRRIASLLR